MHRLSTELSTLQQSSVLDIKQHAAQVVNLERKVEECITVSANSVTSVADRSARLEDVVRETELSIRSTVNDTKTEVNYVYFYQSFLFYFMHSFSVVE